MAQCTTSRFWMWLLSLSLVIAVGFFGHSLWRNWLWRQELLGLAGYYGSDRAVDDFTNGKLRLFEFDGEHQVDVFTGRTEGPFEIWNPQYLPSLGYPQFEIRSQPRQSQL